VLPHFVPGPPVEDAEPPADLPARPYFLYAGRLEAAKGPQELVEVFRDYRSADLLVIGDGSLGRRLRRRAAGLPHVRFLGELHPGRLSNYYARAAAVLVPTLCYETFGLTAAEAMSCGTPVIARDIGALAEIVRDSGGGLTFSTREELVAAMERVRTDPALGVALAERGRDAWRRRWSPQVHLQRYLGLVRSTLSSRAGPAPEAGE
jgi:glycosyltransferase involved in cell wall biosynthesis